MGWDAARVLRSENLVRRRSPGPQTLSRRTGPPQAHLGQPQSPRNSTCAPAGCLDCGPPPQTPAALLPPSSLPPGHGGPRAGPGEGHACVGSNRRRPAPGHRRGCRRRRHCRAGRRRTARRSSTAAGPRRRAAACQPHAARWRQVRGMDACCWRLRPCPGRRLPLTCQLSSNSPMQRPHAPHLPQRAGHPARAAPALRRRRGVHDGR